MFVGYFYCLLVVYIWVFFKVNIVISVIIKFLIIGIFIGFNFYISFIVI